MSASRCLKMLGLREGSEGRDTLKLGWGVRQKSTSSSKVTAELSLLVQVMFYYIGASHVLLQLAVSPAGKSEE